MRQLRDAPRLASAQRALRRPPMLALGLRAAARTVLPSLPRLPSLNSSSSRCLSTSAPRMADDPKKRRIDMDRFPPERIRNLSIIAHIDHGKSTLADRLLQMTNTLPPESSPQFLDKLKVERERGITVKAQTVSIIHKHKDGQEYLINLIDTPGHVDFSYEVSRSLGACEGGLLLVDCSQGIQAQTLSVFHHAVEADLKLLPVINKVDLPHASPEETSEEIASSLGLPVEDHMYISAKSGLGVSTVLDSIIESLPSPKWEGDSKLRALVFDTFYDRFRGVVSLVRIISGELRKGDKVRFLQAGKKYDVLDVGIQNPDEVQVDALREGQVGYLVCNMKNSDEAFIGDTVCLVDRPVEPLPGFQPMKAMVYAGVFPMDAGEFPLLEESIARLTLNDRSVSIERESSVALGQGFRLGFLGTLHMDVFRQRLEDEYSSNVIVTAPTVPYKVVYTNGKEEFISNPAEFPDVTDTKLRVAHIEEPMVNATIFVPTDYIGAMMELCAKYRGVQQEYRHLEGTDRAILRYSLPLSEIVTDFFSELKSASSGFASFDYEEAGYEQSNLVKLNLLLNGKPVDALAMIVHKNAATLVGRAWTKKLREVLPRQLFELAIQASVGARVVARETLSAMRKDVTAGLYGGHYERKMKHLNKQKEGKKRLKSLAGNIQIPQSAFFEVLSTRPRGYATRAIPIDEHLPPLPPTDLPTAESQRMDPFPRHNMMPQQRSQLLSSLHKKTWSPNATSEDIFADFTRLYLSSQTPTFSPDELKSIAMAMHTLDRRAGRRVTDAAAGERFETVINALRDVGGEDVPGLELAILVSSVGAPGPAQLKRAEKAFVSLFPSVPSPLTNEYKMALNHLLYLCALGGDASQFERWWTRMVDEGIEPGSRAFLARVLLHGERRDVPAMLAALEPLESLGKDGVTLVNCAMWKAAEMEQWELVSALFNSLHTTSVSDVHKALASFPQLRPLASTLCSLQADKVTFSLLVKAYATKGDLVSALTALRHMYDAAFSPGVDEYMSLFRGFAHFGVIPAGPSADTNTAFPLWRDTRASAAAGIDNPWAEERDVFTSNYPPSSAGLWTRSALEDLFAAFLALSPASGTRGKRAPGSKGVYHTLLAFGRVTNGEPHIVLETLEAVRQKFGPGNPEGWVGWHESARVTKLVAKLA